jgi:hypothetical protein
MRGWGGGERRGEGEAGVDKEGERKGMTRGIHASVCGGGELNELGFREREMESLEVRRAIESN